MFSIKAKLRQPTSNDGQAVYQLVKNSPPLDLNSPYFYLIQSSHLASTCAVAEVNGKVVGWVSGHLMPNNPATYFLWQVAISEEVRGQGMALKLIQHILSRPNCQQVTHLETSITPSNLASWALFTRLANKLNTQLNKSLLFSAKQLGGEEDEELARIGPFSSANLAGF